MRIGHGYDVHRLVEGRKLILGGVDIPWEKGLLGHSDADVLTHAIMDALSASPRPGTGWATSTPLSWPNALSWLPTFHRCGPIWPPGWV